MTQPPTALGRFPAAFSRLVAVASVKHRRLAAGSLRICLGGITLIFYALHVAQRELLWGPNAAVTPQDAAVIMSANHSWSLYGLFPSELGFEVLFWTGFVVTLAFAFGVGGRITTILFYVFTWSIYQRDYYAIDGGENLLIILAFYMMFMDLTALSVDQQLGWFKNRPNTWVGAMIHNAALVACLLQLSIMYFVSDFFKIQGHVWADGTALYYILRTNEFSLPPLTDHLFRNQLLVVSGTYATIIFEAMYPWAIWHPRLKYAVLAGVIALHLSIGVFMGLVFFSLTMICVDLLFFDDKELITLASWIANRFHWVTTLIGDAIDYAKGSGKPVSDER